MTIRKISFFYAILTRLGRFKRILTRTRKYLIFFLLSTVVTITILSMQCLHSPETCIVASWAAKSHRFTRASSKQVKCPWDYYIEHYPLSDVTDFEKTMSMEVKNTANITRDSLTEESFEKLAISPRNLNIDSARKTSVNNKPNQIWENVNNNKSVFVQNIGKNSSEIPIVDGNIFTEKRDLAEIPRTSYSASTITENITEINRCKPLYPQILIYNRIFKTGSTATLSFFKKCSKKLKYVFKTDTTEPWSNERKKHRILKHMKKRANRAKRKKKRLFVGAHFYFRKKLHLSMNHTYINVVRDPVQRYISYYYYVRSPDRWPKRLKRLKKLGHFNETIEECLENQHEGCIWNQMTRFFCGPEAFCKTGSRKALKRAKHNMKNHYASVGISENLTEFIHVLSKLLPGFVVDAPSKMEKSHVTTGVKRNSISESVMAKIINANKADIKLYNFAKNLFQKQAEQCGIKINS